MCFHHQPQTHWQREIHVVCVGIGCGTLAQALAVVLVPVLRASWTVGVVAVIESGHTDAVVGGGGDGAGAGVVCVDTVDPRSLKKERVVVVE